MKKYEQKMKDKYQEADYMDLFNWNNNISKMAAGYKKTKTKKAKKTKIKRRLAGKLDSIIMKLDNDKLESFSYC